MQKTRASSITFFRPNHPDFVLFQRYFKAPGGRISKTEKAGCSQATRAAAVFSRHGAHREVKGEEESAHIFKTHTYLIQQQGEPPSPMTGIRRFSLCVKESQTVDKFQRPNSIGKSRGIQVGSFVCQMVGHVIDVVV